LPTNEALTDEVVVALQQCAIVQHPKHGVVYAFELGGYGSALLMDDANIPCLLSQQTIRCISIPTALPYRPDNPWFFKGDPFEGNGSPHTLAPMIWPMSIIMRALTSNQDDEIHHSLPANAKNQPRQHMANARIFCGRPARPLYPQLVCMG
jgi:meiotically up-regulated gene 157 (Mug157) protein